MGSQYVAMTVVIDLLQRFQSNRHNRSIATVIRTYCYSYSETIAIDITIVAVDLYLRPQMRRVLNRRYRPIATVFEPIARGFWGSNSSLM